jgi:hypothetical protein
MSDRSRLRPIERCILSLDARGLPDDEIAWKLGRSPEFVRRVRALTRVPRTPSPRHQHRLRPIERCILRWRDRGEGYVDVAARFHRSPGFVEFVEELAEYKLSH